MDWFTFICNISHGLQLDKFIAELINFTCLFVFLPLQPIVVVFSQPDSGL